MVDAGIGDGLQPTDLDGVRQVAFAEQADVLGMDRNLGYAGDERIA